MQVTDASGGSVGTVKAIQGANLLIKTDKHEALLPTTSFTLADGKLLFGMTQAQLDAADRAEPRGRERCDCRRSDGQGFRRNASRERSIRSPTARSR